ncbi:MAG: vitamin K epoxide reductase family protein [Nitrososphaerales archaeon]|nr:vitamin K epoxide reductase family protein [Nitrososphaerales archaeon]
MRISWPKFLVLIVMSLLGITASSIVFYLYDTLRQQLPVCYPNQSFLGISLNCEAVLSSQYNSIYGLNLDLLASAYFIVSLALVCLVAFGSDWFYAKAFRVLFAWRFLGLIIVPYLMVVEFLILRTICIYCTMMHVAILVDFGIITYFLYYKKDVKSFLRTNR